MDNLYARIQTLCEQNNIRPGRLCDLLGLSRSLMTDLKMGRKKTVSAETAHKIAGFFRVSVEYLMGQEAPTVTGRDVLEEVDLAFYGDFKTLDEDEKETVRDMVRLMRKRRAARQRT